MRVDRHSKGGAEQLEQRAGQARKRQTSALSTPERLGDSTKFHQVGVHLNPTYRRPDVHSVLIHSHPDVGPCGGRPLAAAAALLSGEVTLELQRMQHSIQKTLEQSRDPGRRRRVRTPTAVK